jgi:hypothetical protein
MRLIGTCFSFLYSKLKIRFLGKVHVFYESTGQLLGCEGKDRPRKRIEKILVASRKFNHVQQSSVTP